MPVYFDNVRSVLQIITSRYPPQGLRSWGPTRALILEAGPPDANKYVKAFAMIETAEAIKNLDAILDVEGLDGVFVGNTPISTLSSPILNSIITQAPTTSQYRWE